MSIDISYTYFLLVRPFFLTELSTPGTSKTRTPTVTDIEPSTLTSTTVSTKIDTKTRSLTERETSTTVSAQTARRP